MLWINNQAIAQIAREAGAPKDKGAGVMLKVKLGDKVKRDEAILEIYAERNTKLEAAEKTAKTLQLVGIGKRWEEKMLIDQIPAKAIHPRPFTIER